MLEKVMGHKYIDGAGPLKGRTTAKCTPQNKEMTKSYKKTTIQREEQRQKPLLLFPLEGEWLMRGQGIPSKAKA